MIRIVSDWASVTIKLLDQSDLPLAQGSTQGWMNKFEITAGAYTKEQCKDIKLFKQGEGRLLFLHLDFSDVLPVGGNFSVGANGMLELAGDTSGVTALLHVDDEV